MSDKTINFVVGIIGLFMTGCAIVSCVDHSEPIPPEKPPIHQPTEQQYFGIPGGPDLPAGVECPLEQPKLIQGGNDY